MKNYRFWIKSKDPGRVEAGQTKELGWNQWQSKRVKFVQTGRAEQPCSARPSGRLGGVEAGGCWAVIDLMRHGSGSSGSESKSETNSFGSGRATWMLWQTNTTETSSGEGSTGVERSLAAQRRETRDQNLIGEGGYVPRPNFWVP